MVHEVAIIGMAMRCADAENTKQLMENLKIGKDSVRRFTEKRIRETSIDTGRPLRQIGYMEDIDKFDYSLFHLSKAEAAMMDPHHRLLLESVYEAINDSGYSTDYFYGSKSSVYLAAINPEYYKMADEFDDVMISGNSPAFAAARIARQFNLTGNALIVDTACSSSLEALNIAFNEIRLGDTDYAFVGGANLNFLPYSDKDDEASIWSHDGKSRAFSEQADGMSCGEVSACIILKSLDKALEDHDYIHAVISTVAVNNNANRSASPSAPDSVSQANMLVTAWNKAGINPEDIGFIEAHGSGTKLGDSLEIEGLDMAFKKYTDKSQICPISTIKSNIGHPYSGSGLAGLIKTVLSLENGVLYPSIHVKELNKMIDFKHAPVYVETEYRPWERKDGKPRIAGLTSLGASGTNCHVILREASEHEVSKESKTEDGTQIFTISSKTEDGLKRNIKNFIEYLKEDYKNESLQDLACNMNIGRHHFDRRVVINAATVTEIQNNFEALFLDKKEHKACKAEENYIVLTDADIALPVFESCLKANDTFKKAVAECKGFSTENSTDRSFMFEYGMYSLMKAMGVKVRNIISGGIGKIAANVVSEKLTMEEALEKCKSYQKKPEQELKERFQKMLEKRNVEGLSDFLVLTPGEEMTEALKQLEAEAKMIRVLHLHTENTERILHDFIGQLYQAGYDLNWSVWQNQRKYYHIPLPAYSFEKNRCWLRETPWIEQRKEKPAESVMNLEGLSFIERKMAECWQEQLNIQIADIDKDFFECGGNSLTATAVIKELHKLLGVELSFEDMFDFPTIREMSEYLTGCLSEEQQIIIIFSDILKMEDILATDSFFELGGHSLMANQLLIRLKEQLGVSLNFDDVFRHPSARELAEFIDENKEKKGQLEEYPLSRIPDADYYETSDAQKRMWVMSQFHGGSSAYNSPFSIVLHGKAEFDILKKTIKETLKRHESLRTVFVQKDNVLLQKVLKPEEIEISFEKAEADSEADAEKIIEEDMNLEFNLLTGPLVRGKVFWVGEKTIIYFNIHHIVHDGWSSKVFLNDITTLYNAFSNELENPLAPLPIQYRDYAKWQNQILNSTFMKESEEYWKKIFAEKVSPLNLTISKPRMEEKRYIGAKVKSIISYSKMQEIKKFCQENGITLYMFLMSALNVLLYKYSGQEDIVIGSPIAGRSQELLQNQIGYYANTIALRNKVSGELKLSEVIHQVKVSALGAFNHQDYPFDRLTSIIDYDRVQNRNFLFDIMMVLQNTDMVLEQDLELNGMKIEQINDLGISSLFDLHFEFIEGDCGITQAINYDTDLFDEKDIELLAANLKKIYDCMLESDSEVDEIELDNLKDNFNVAEWEMDALLDALNQNMD